MRRQITADNRASPVTHSQVIQVTTTTTVMTTQVRPQPYMRQPQIILSREEWRQVPGADAHNPLRGSIAQTNAMLQQAELRTSINSCTRPLPSAQVVRPRDAHFRNF